MIITQINLIYLLPVESFTWYRIIKYSFYSKWIFHQKCSLAHVSNKQTGEYDSGKCYLEPKKGKERVVKLSMSDNEQNVQNIM